MRPREVEWSEAGPRWVAVWINLLLALGLWLIVGTVGYVVWVVVRDGL